MSADKNDGMTTNTSPSQAIAFFTELRDRGHISTRERGLALKRWAQSHSGTTWLIQKGRAFRFDSEAITCDCGKGLQCPLVKVGGQ